MALLKKDNIQSLYPSTNSQFSYTFDGKQSTNKKEQHNNLSKINNSNINKENDETNLVEVDPFEKYSKVDREKIFQKEIKIEYRDKNENKNNPIGMKQNKQKFEWGQHKKLLDYVLRENLLVFIIYTPFLISTTSKALIPYMVGKLLNEVTRVYSDSNVESKNLILLGLIFITCFFGFFRALHTNLLGSKVFCIYKEISLTSLLVTMLLSSKNIKQVIQ
ncbi:hypothetical protein ABPG72_001477 [Tetrahymena utriculariae]